MSRRLAPLVVAAVLVACQAGGPSRGGTVRDRDQMEPNPRIWLLTEEKEIEIGREVSNAIQREYPIYAHPALQAYIDEVGIRMAAVSDRPDLEYEFKVLDSPIVNAFAAPGGFIFISRGILGVIEDEADLAGVLGHEIGHVAARHSVQMIQRATTVNIVGTIASILLQGRVSPDIFRGAAVALNLVFLGYSREFEQQADLLGMKYLYEAGYDPRGMLDVLDALRRESKERPNAFFQIFRSHPYPENRMEHIRGWLAKTYEADTWAGPRPAEMHRGAERYREIAFPHALVGGQADVRSAVETYRIALMRRDLEMAMSVISEDYRDLEGRTRADIERDLRRFIGSYHRIDYLVTSIDVTVEGDRAEARYNYDLRAVDYERGVEARETGREYLDLRREPGEAEGEHVWRITSSRTVRY